MKTSMKVLLLMSITLFLVGCASGGVVCKKPYIHVGSDCCLDQNDNDICDNDEGSVDIKATKGDAKGTSAPATASQAVQSYPSSNKDSAYSKSTSTPSRSSSRSSSTGVFINNRELSKTQLQELESTYGGKAEPGNYWYDPVSGWTGKMGEAASSYMLPGHEYGSLPSDASNGNTGLYTNGRELTEEEVVFLEYVFRTPRQPGRYWMDAYGNMGVEGSSYPLANIYTAINQASGGGSSGGGSSGGGGGDNFWASNAIDSAGNEGADGFGYVNAGGTLVCYPGCF